MFASKCSPPHKILVDSSGVLIKLTVWAEWSQIFSSYGNSNIFFWTSQIFSRFFWSSGSGIYSDSRLTPVCFCIAHPRLRLGGLIKGTNHNSNEILTKAPSNERIFSKWSNWLFVSALSLVSTNFCRSLYLNWKMSLLIIFCAKIICKNTWRK